MNTHALMLVVTMSGFTLPVFAQDPPPATPPPVTQPPVTPPQAPIPSAGVPSVPVAAPAGEVAKPVAPPAPVALSNDQVRQRLQAIYYLESGLIAAVKLAAMQTANEIRTIQPGLMMFTGSPIKAHGTYLEGYGVVFHIEIPRVIPSVASLVETLGRDAANRERSRSNPAQPFSVASAPSDAILNPDAHYVQSVKTELINTMVKMSQGLELQPGETLTVSARDGSDMPGQVAAPSTLTLHVKGNDLTEFTAGRISLNEIIRRVIVRGF